VAAVDSELAERAKLTARQREILEMWAQGASATSIALALDRDRSTIHQTIKRALQKLEIAAREDAAA